MKVAIPVDGTSVSQHFGHCESFLIYEIEDDKLKEQSIIKNPGHEPGVLPKMLAEEGVSCLIAGGLGSNAQRIFKDAGINLIVGVGGEAEDVIQNYLQGNLEVGDNSCDH